MEYSELYARGWVIAPKSISPELFDVPKYFDRIDLGHTYFLLRDPRTSLTMESKGDYFIVLIGIVVDVDHADSDIAQVVGNLLEKFIIHGPEGEIFLSALDALTGRYAVFLINREQCFVYNDALGLRSVYYHAQISVCASHYAIINSLANEGLCAFDYEQICADHRNVRAVVPWVLPGDLTPYSRIFLLVPGFSLALPNHSLKRFFPRHPVRKVNLHECADYLANAIHCIMENVTARFDTLFAISGGWDSRLSLAGCKGLTDKIRFFSYSYTPDSDAAWAKELKIEMDNDLQIAMMISRKFGLDHRILPIPIEGGIDHPHLDLFKRNHYHKHIPDVPYQFEKCGFLTNNSLYIRSFTTEVFRRSYFNFDTAHTCDDFASLMTKFSMYSPNSIYFEQVKQYYIEYINKYHSKEIIELGYNYSDIFFICYRMAMWTAVPLLETDTVCESFIPYNCRKFIDLAINIPREYKDRSTLCELIIKNAWPELLEYVPYPNTIIPLARYANFHLNDAYGFRSFIDPKTNDKTFNTYSSTSNNYLIETGPDFINMGFANNIVEKGEYVDIVLYYSCIFRCTYYLTLTITTQWKAYVGKGWIRYEIYVDNKLIYHLNPQQFSKPNQITYLFEASRTDRVELKIKLICIEKSPPILHNSIIKINNLIFRQEYGVKLAQPIFLCTQSQISSLLS